jgi:hypothetical protein
MAGGGDNRGLGKPRIESPGLVGIAGAGGAGVVGKGVLPKYGGLGGFAPSPGFASKVWTRQGPVSASLFAAYYQELGILLIDLSVRREVRELKPVFPLEIQPLLPHLLEQSGRTATACFLTSSPVLWARPATCEDFYLSRSKGTDTLTCPLLALRSFP